MADKIARPGSEGNTRLLKQYGGGSEPPRQSYSGVKGYATGGAVRGDNPSLSEGIEASGSAAKKNLSRPGRKAPGKDKKEAKTNITIVVAPKGGDDKAAMPMPPPGASAAVAPPSMPPMPPPGMAGPGGPPMPMRAKGGRVVKKADGGEVDDQPVSKYLRKRADEEDSKATASVFPSAVGIGTALGAIHPVARIIGAGIAAAGAPLLKSGYEATKKKHQLKDAAEAFDKTGLPGRPSHADAYDAGKDAGRKTGGRVERSVGGPAKPLKMEDGAGGGEGRLDKMRKYGK